MLYSKSSTAADLVPVMINTWPVLYVYTKFELLLAYGVSCLCALGCSLFGLWVFYVNDASYQNTFSTFLRATNDSKIRSQVSSGDQGADPLPKTLAKAVVTLSGYRRVSQSSSDSAEAIDTEMQNLRPDDSYAVAPTSPVDTSTTTGDPPSPQQSFANSPSIAVISTDDLGRRT